MDNLSSDSDVTHSLPITCEHCGETTRLTLGAGAAPVHRPRRIRARLSARPIRLHAEPMMCVEMNPDRAIEFAEGLLRAVRGES
jgi:hypothetical protein